MERDDVIIGLAKLQVTTEEILKRLEEYKQEQEEINERIRQVEKQIYYAGGALAFVVALFPYAWDYIKHKMGLAT